MTKEEIGNSVGDLLLRFLRGEISEEEMERRAMELTKKRQEGEKDGLGDIQLD